jgi:hypothetical protein
MIGFWGHGHALVLARATPPALWRGRRFEFIRTLSNDVPLRDHFRVFNSFLYIFFLSLFFFFVVYIFGKLKSEMSSSSSSSIPKSSKSRGKKAVKRPSKRPMNVVVQHNKQKVIVGRTPTLSSYLRKCAAQMIAPGSSGSRPVVLPSSGTSQVCSRHIHKEFDISEADYPNGFAILIEPDFETPSYISALDTVAVPSASAGKLVISGESSATAASSSVGQWKCKSGSSESAVVANTVATIAGVEWMILDVAATASSHATFHAQDRSPNQGTYAILLATQVGADPVEPLAEILMSQSEASTTDLGLLPLCDRILWRFVDAGDPSAAEMVWHFAEAQITSDTANALSPAFTRFATEYGVTEGRVVSIGCLVTNTSPAIQKGGNINAARVPRSFRLFDEPIGNMSSLPDNRRYQSTAETGSYVFWIPKQLDEFEIDGLSEKYKQYKNADRLFISCTGYPAGATFKVHVDWIIEFYTPNQLFEKAVAPHMNAQMEELLRVIASMPAAMCNPEHENATNKTLESWKQTGSDVLDTVKSGVEFVEKYGPLLYEIAQVLAELV